MMFVLGRRIPTSWEHVSKYPLSFAMPISVVKVEKILKLPWHHWQAEQGSTSSCVGHAVVMERAISNGSQNAWVNLFRPSRRYDPIWQWEQAKVVDEWLDTNIGDNNGTSIRAAYQVAKDIGVKRARRIYLNADERPVVIGSDTPDPAEGVTTYRWAADVDEIRTALQKGLPVVIGVFWWSDMMPSELIHLRNSDWWIREKQRPQDVVLGGHAVCLYGASDKRQAFRLKNSWGRSFPLVWLPYSRMEMLLRDQGEAVVAVDR